LIQSILSHPISLKSILILSCNNSMQIYWGVSRIQYSDFDQLILTLYFVLFIASNLLDLNTLFSCDVWNFRGSKKITVLWGILPFGLKERYQRLEGT
jgi:hypothetical protein